jgi:hypothetical protein
MRRFFFFFIAVAFLVRGFAGDAMAVTMAHDALNVPAQTTSSTAPAGTSCHDMGMDKKSSTMSHAHCQLCCAVIAISSAELLTFDQAAFVARPISFTPRFASNDLLPAFKPPIL